MSDDFLFYDFVELLLTGVGWETTEDDDEKQPQLATKNFSPLEMVLMMKADLEIVREVHDMYPQALNKRLLKNACNYGAKPGVVGFLVGKLEAKCVSSEIPNLLHGAMSGGPGPDRPSEDDLMKLIEIYPPSLLEENEYGMTPLEVCLRLKYSANFISSLLHQLSILGVPKQPYGLQQGKRLLLVRDHHTKEFSPDVDEDMIREGITVDCAKALSTLLPHVDGVFLADQNWTIAALLNFFYRILQHQNITGMTLTENGFVEVDGEEDDSSKLLDKTGKQLRPSLLNPLREAATKCKVETLEMDFSYITPIFPGLLNDCIVLMPCLRALDIHLPRLLLHENTPNALVQLLQTRKSLERLELGVDIATEQGLVPVLDCLWSNTTLKCFTCFVADLPITHYTTCQGLLVDIVETSNTTLEEASFQAYGIGRDMEKERLIQYCTALNKCGRGVARNPNTRLEDFVDLLRPDRRCMPWDLTLVRHIQYGLLRESPALWSSPHHGVQSPARKRKSGTILHSQESKKRCRQSSIADTTGGRSM